MRVMTHDDPTRQDSHDTAEVQALCQEVGPVREQTHRAELERGGFLEGYVFEEEG